MQVSKQSRFSRVQLFATPWTVARQLLCPWDFAGKKTGVGCHFLLLQGIFPTQGSLLCLLNLPHWIEGSFPLAPPGNTPIRNIKCTMHWSLVHSQSCETIITINCRISSSPKRDPVPVEARLFSPSLLFSCSSATTMLRLCFCRFSHSENFI